MVGDGCSIVYVQDILVLEAYQRKGIGRKLMESMLQEFHDIRQIVLITDDSKKTRSFYESAGMHLVANTGGLCYVRYNTKAENTKMPAIRHFLSPVLFRNRDPVLPSRCGRVFLQSDCEFLGFQFVAGVF